MIYLSVDVSTNPVSALTWTSPMNVAMNNGYMKFVYQNCGTKNKLNILRWSSLNLILSPAVLTDEFLVFVIQFIFVYSRVYNDPTQ